MDNASDILVAALTGFLSGLLLSIPVGPINLTIMNEGARRGFKWAALIGLGVVLATQFVPRRVRSWAGLVGAALVIRVFSPQTAVGQVSRVPSDRSLYHPEAKSGSTFTRCWLISCCQRLATCMEGESLMPATQVSPEVANHFAPACQARPANKSGDPLPLSKGDLEERLSEVAGVVDGRIEAVCCEGPSATLFIGVEERGAAHFGTHGAPAGSAGLPRSGAFPACSALNILA